MIQLKNITYHIGINPLLSDINWNIQIGERLALIGKNGIGKTTLFRIINKELQPDFGEIIKPKGFQIGYLPQEEITIERGDVLSTVLEGHAVLLQLEKEMHTIRERLNDLSANDRQKDIYRLGELESRFQILNGYQLESQAKKILSGLGFHQTDFHRPLSDLSGGWRMRAYLARLLLQRPSLLLLDEPTNHLDIPALEWLENFLLNFDGAVVSVSHDRFFIDRLANQIVELENAGLKFYPGKYHDYEIQKKLEYEQLQQKWEDQQKEKARQQKFIDRFRYKASKASQVQSRIKQLEKMEKIELPASQKSIQIKIKVDKPSYKDVLKIQNMGFRYDENWVLKDINFELYRGEKVALVGANGAGKTTFTRIITGNLKNQKGMVHLGNNVAIGYYAQHQIEQLTLENTIFEEVLSTAADSYHAHIRDILGLFHLSGKDIDKQIKMLSGGEKARVSLAKILMSPSNLLIMDEPTNHLDLSSKQALEAALKEYDGTLILISHDRYFLDKLVNRVVELKAGELSTFEGNYSDYLSKREADSQQIQEAANSDENIETRQKDKERKQKEAAARQAISKDRRRLEYEIQELEKKIEFIENQKTQIELDIAKPESYQKSEYAVNLQIKYDQLKKDLDPLIQQWEKLQNEYERLLSSLVPSS